MKSISAADLLGKGSVFKKECKSKNDCLFKPFKPKSSKIKSLNIFKNIRTASG